MTSVARKVLFLYLGRRGALGRFTLELAQAANEIPNLEPIFAISGQNESISEFGWLKNRLLPLETFTNVASIAVVKNFFAAREKLLERISASGVTTVVTLMPHIWTPLLARSIRSRGVRYQTIIHDLVRHPGDPTAVVVPWLRSEARLADRVITLSRATADHLIENGFANQTNTRALFLPDLRYGAISQTKRRQADAPLRLLFMGRIFKYKGLRLLLNSLEILRAEGVAVHLGVAGAGDISDVRVRLAALGAEVINRWLDDEEIAPLLARYDAMVLPYIEASQSGVAAVAFASCMPVIATPCGGLSEQVVEGKTGVIAQDTSAHAFAVAVRRLAQHPDLFERISWSLKVTGADRSMRTFIDQLLDDHSRSVADTKTLDGRAPRRPSDE